MSVTMQTCKTSDSRLTCAACGQPIKNGECYLESYGFKRVGGYGGQSHLRGAVLWTRHEGCKKSIATIVRRGAVLGVSKA